MKKHTVTIHGHMTSISLEDEFWDALQQDAATKGVSLASLVAKIDEERITSGTAGLSSAIRVYLFKDLAQKVKSGTL